MGVNRKKSDNGDVDDDPIAELPPLPSFRSQSPTASPGVGGFPPASTPIGGAPPSAPGAPGGAPAGLMMGGEPAVLVPQALQEIQKQIALIDSQVPGFAMIANQTIEQWKGVLASGMADSVAGGTPFTTPGVSGALPPPAMGGGGMPGMPPPPPPPPSGGGMPPM